MSTSVTSPTPAYDPRAWVTPEDLNVAPQLLGLPLAKPKQRFWAMAIDLAVLAPLSNLGNFFLLLAGGSALLLWIRRPGGGGKVLSDGRRRGLWVLLFISLALGGQQAWEDWREPSARRSEAEDEEAAAATAAALATAQAALAGLPDSVASAASAASVAAALPGPAASAGRAEQSDAQRIAKLEAQVKAQQAQLDQHHFDPRAEFKRLVNEVGLSYFWALLYFSILPVLLSGQTLGKKLLGLRVVELTGKPLTPMICFKRYGGYAAGMATGMTGFLQLLWDSNRQAIQDKTAHTVVIDARSGKRLALPEAV
ncbi:hypothetical protein DBR47_19010 [Paucibacter sp. KBW04]|uniref:RDD family protein n=1 Tax=Paucibacter sp. KBW04 TaxID=2153361 RepID=UPI000F5791C8|nr:RDD family protein [Paucibacter sp. KBW04]RQO55955.1 hypothetical protein DBR47_19010 [Paucibacter sp. KBW04]